MLVLEKWAEVYRRWRSIVGFLIPYTSVCVTGKQKAYRQWASGILTFLHLDVIYIETSWRVRLGVFLALVWLLKHHMAKFS